MANYIFTNGIPFNEKKKDYLIKFLDYTYKVLALKGTETAKIRFVPQRDKDHSLETYALYNEKTSFVVIDTEGRAFGDICRSLGHELTHKKQFTKPNAKNRPEKDLEAEANSVAGKIIRAFGKKYSEIYDEKALEATEEQFAEINQLATKLEELTGMQVALPEYIRKRGSDYVVVSKKGKTLGTHDTKQDAQKQLAAIEINKHIDEDLLSSTSIEEGDNCQVYPLGDGHSGVLVAYGKVTGVDEDLEGNVLISFSKDPHSEESMDAGTAMWYSDAEYDIVKVDVTDSKFRKGTGYIQTGQNINSPNMKNENSSNTDVDYINLIPSMSDDELDSHYGVESPFGDQPWSAKFKALHNELIRREKDPKSKFYIKNEEVQKVVEALERLTGRKISFQESYVQKDINRINDIVTKSSKVTANGIEPDEMKMVQLALVMANKITEPQKALGRGLAAEKVLGKENKLSPIFYKRAKDLGVDVDSERKVLDQNIQLGKKRGPLGNRKPTSAIPILPVGKVDLVTGENSHGWNIYSNGESTLEIWKAENGALKCVSTSGNKPIFNVGDKARFIHDQTGRPLFNAIMVDYIEAENAKLLIPEYGKSLAFYVYK